MPERFFLIDLRKLFKLRDLPACGACHGSQSIKNRGFRGKVFRNKGLSRNCPALGERFYDLMVQANDSM
jgi:hypothetical protein